MSVRNSVYSNEHAYLRNFIKACVNQYVCMDMRTERYWVDYANAQGDRVFNVCFWVFVGFSQDDMM